MNWRRTILAAVLAASALLRCADPGPDAPTGSDDASAETVDGAEQDACVDVSDVVEDDTGAVDVAPETDPTGDASDGDEDTATSDATQDPGDTDTVPADGGYLRDGEDDTVGDDIVVDTTTADSEIDEPDGDPPPEPVFRFEDVTAAAGIEGVHWEVSETFDSAICGEAALLSGGAAASDFDGDGDVDIFVARLGLPDRLYVNDGDGHFDDAAPAFGLDHRGSSNGAAWVDFDGDGDLDLYVTTIADDPHRLYVQGPDGAFVEAAAAHGIALDDEDDRPRGCGYYFTPSFGDPDGDGDLDLFVAAWIASGRVWGSRFFENTGRGSFVDRTVEAGLHREARSVVFMGTFFHADDDSNVDLLVTADFGTSQYFANRGDGTFVNRTAESALGTDENGMGTAIADVDGDGDLDVFVTAISGRAELAECGMTWGCTGNRLYLNGGDGLFEDRTDAWGVRDGGWGWGAAFFDMDNDADLDLAMTNGYDLPWTGPRFDRFRPGLVHYHDDAARLWERTDGRRFRDIAAVVGFGDTRRGRTLLPLDIDGDGDLDVFVANNGSEPLLLKNSGVDGHHFVRVAPRGVGAASFGVGTRVEMRRSPGARWIRRDISASGTFLGSVPFVAHYGLGPDAAAVDALRVTWPDGAVTELTDVAVDQTVVVRPP